MSGFAECVVIFHALAGLCAGWIWGARSGVPESIGFALVGCAVGFIAGFLISQVPRACSLVKARISRKFRFFALMFALSGLIAGIVFWSICLHCI